MQNENRSESSESLSNSTNDFNCSNVRNSASALWSTPLSSPDVKRPICKAKKGRPSKASTWINVKSSSDGDVRVCAKRQRPVDCFSLDKTIPKFKNKKVTHNSLSDFAGDSRRVISLATFVRDNLDSFLVRTLMSSLDTMAEEKNAIFQKLNEIIMRQQSIESRLDDLITGNNARFDNIDKQIQDVSLSCKSLEGRVTDCEDRQRAWEEKNAITSPTVLVNKIEDIKASIKTDIVDKLPTIVSSEIGQLHAEVLRQGRELRKNNIVIKGLKITEENIKVQVERFLSTEFNLQNCVCEARIINKVKCIVLAKIIDNSTKGQIMKNKAAVLGDRNIFIQNDLTASDAVIAKRLRDKKKDLCTLSLKEKM